MRFYTAFARIWLAIGLMFSAISFAEETAIERSPDITLSSLVSKVYERQLSQSKQHAQQQRVDANNELANALFAGQASVNLEHFNDVIGSSDGFQEWQSSVELPLWLPGQQQQQLALSGPLSAEIPAYQQALLLDAAAATRSLVWAVIEAETNVQQRYQVWQAAQKLEENVSSRVTAGELAGTEALLAKSHALDMKSQYLEAKTQLDFAWQNYQNYTGENMLPEHFQEELSSQTEVNLQHPYLVVLEQEAATLRAEQDLARFDGAINPNLSVGLRRERDDHHDDYTNSVGVGISFALDNEVYQNPNIAKVASAMADVDIERQKLARELQAKLLRSHHSLMAKQQQLALVNEQDETTKQYLLLQQRAFDLGEIDLVNLLRSQVLANDTVNRKASLEVAVNHAISMVNQALGIIP
jgi:outer membrane protein, heavy metal efflux system